MSQVDRAVDRWAQTHRDLMVRLQDVFWNSTQASAEEKYVVVLDHVRQVLGADPGKYSMTDITTLLLACFTLGLKEQDATVKQVLCFTPTAIDPTDLVDRIYQTRSSWVDVDWIQVSTRMLERQGTLQRLADTELPTK